MTRLAAASRLGLPRRTGGTVRAAEAGRDRAAFEAAYRDCHQELYRYACSIVRDEHLAEDVLQSTMEKALVALRNETRDFELRPWLFRIAHNEAISRLRRERPTVELADAHAVAAGAPVADQLDDKQRLDQLWVDLSTLPERQRQALVLRELSGLGHDEIGAVLGSSGRAVKQTIFEARRALLECSEGRAMQCDDVQRTLSDGDGRVRRGRRLQSHLRGCQDCRAFDLALNERPEQLRALAPVLPLAAAASILGQLAPGAPAALLGHAAPAAGTAGTAAGSAGWSVGSLGSVVASKATVVAVAAVTAVGATGVAAVEVSQRATPSSTVTAPAGQAAGGPTRTASPAGPPSGLPAAAGAMLPAGGASGAVVPRASAPASSPSERRAATPSSQASKVQPDEATAGKSRAAANKAAARARAGAAKERAAARRRAAGSGSGRSKSAGQAPSTSAKPKSGATKPRGGGGTPPPPSPAPAKPTAPPSGSGATPSPAAPAPAGQGNGGAAGGAGGGGGTAPGAGNKPAR